MVGSQHPPPPANSPPSMVRPSSRVRSIIVHICRVLISMSHSDRRDRHSRQVIVQLSTHAPTSVIDCGGGDQTVRKTNGGFLNDGHKHTLTHV